MPASLAALALLLGSGLQAVPVDKTCPAGTQYVDGKGCLARVADPGCPAGTRFDGAKCVAVVDTSCPAGMVFVAGTGCVAAGAPAAKPATPTAPSAPAAAGPASGAAYGDEEILALVKALGDKQALSATKLADLTANLKKSLGDREFKKMAGERPVRGVLVYQGGEGGLLVKYMSADGLLSLKGGRQAAKVGLRTWSAGAQVGGSAMWGVALVMGLAKDSDLAGDYSGSNVGATAADESTGRALRLSHKDSSKKHVLWVVASGRGLSASAGAAKLTLTADW